MSRRRDAAVSALRRVKHRFDPPEIRFDRAEHERLLALIDATLPGAPGIGVDVGANEGVVLARMIAAAPERRHIAVEPIPALAAELYNRFPGADVFAGALSDRRGEREFAHVTTREGWSGFERRPTPDPADRITTIQVATTTLDELVGDRDVAFVKIDVEGAELEVLRGARGTLRRCRPVVAFEHGLGSADHYGTQPDHVYDLLADDLGMEIRDLEGGGPYGRSGFSAAFWNQDRVNFVARPR